MPKPKKKKGKPRGKGRRAKGGLLPLLLFGLFCAGIATVAVIEIRNYIEYPTLQTFGNPDTGARFTLYHRGNADRKAALFYEQNQGSDAGPQFITQIFYAEDSPEGDRFEALSWSSDGSSVVATRPRDPARGPGNILWVFDTNRRTLYAAIGGEVIGNGLEQSQSWLRQFVDSRGGVDRVITHWYELGRKENYVFSWSTTRWERALPD